MYSNEINTPSVNKWQGLHRLRTPTVDRLDKIQSHLDLVLLALKAIANITSDTILQAAGTLDLESIVKDRVELWQLRLANSGEKNSTVDKIFDVEEARSWVLIICYLAQQEKELLRRAVSLLEQVTIQNQEPHAMTLLGDYLDNFMNLYQSQITDSAIMNRDELSQFSLKLLVDLLFYSGKNGHRLLWLAILGKS